jgi:hypothetical protein
LGNCGLRPLRAAADTDRRTDRYAHPHTGDDRAGDPHAPADRHAPAHADSVADADALADADPPAHADPLAHADPHPYAADPAAAVAVAGGAVIRHRR